MICCAETTLPSSRVRSEALSTNLFSNVLLGRRVIGTVSSSFSLGFVPFAFEGLVGGASRTRPRKRLSSSSISKALLRKL
jgi:hypothetical protein